MPEGIKVRTLVDGWPAGLGLKRGDVFEADPAELEQHKEAGLCCLASDAWAPDPEPVAEPAEVQETPKEAAPRHTRRG